MLDSVWRKKQQVKPKTPVWHRPKTPRCQILRFDVGLMGVSSTVDTCPDRFWREFRGYLSESTGCADWSLDIACRKLVWVSRSMSLIDLTTTYESVEYAD
ncbi:unnamed protein product [Prunus armeniaca]